MWNMWRRFGRISVACLPAPRCAPPGKRLECRLNFCLFIEESAVEIACLDLEGVLVPEIWIAFAEKTGIDALKADRKSTRLNSSHT